MEVPCPWTQVQRIGKDEERGLVLLYKQSLQAEKIAPRSGAEQKAYMDGWQKNNQEDQACRAKTTSERAVGQSLGKGQAFIHCIHRSSSMRQETHSLLETIPLVP